MWIWCVNIIINIKGNTQQNTLVAVDVPIKAAFSDTCKSVQNLTEFLRLIRSSGLLMSSKSFLTVNEVKYLIKEH